MNECINIYIYIHMYPREEDQMSRGDDSPKSPKARKDSK